MSGAQVCVPPANIKCTSDPDVLDLHPFFFFRLICRRLPDGSENDVVLVLLSGRYNVEFSEVVRSQRQSKTQLIHSRLIKVISGEISWLSYFYYVKLFISLRPCVTFG